MTKFNLKSSSKTSKYYNCYKRKKGCKGTGVYNIKENKFYVSNSCDFQIDHDNCNYEKFVNLYLNNKINEIDLNIKKYQRYFIRYLFKNKLVIDKYEAIDKFKKTLEIKF